MTIIVFLVMLSFTSILSYRYARELYLFFTNREEFEAVRARHKISHGEDGSRAVSFVDRLFFSYPAFILVFGFFTVLFGIRALA